MHIQVVEAAESTALSHIDTKNIKSKEFDDNADSSFFTSTTHSYSLNVSRGRKQTIGMRSEQRAPRSRSSPERTIFGVRRTRSPSSEAIPADLFVSAAPTIFAPLLSNDNSNFSGAIAFFSPRPPPAPMYLVPLPPNPEDLATKCTARLVATRGIKPCDPTRTKQKENKSVSKKSKRVVRYVMSAVLEGVFKAIAVPATVQPVQEASLKGSTSEDLSQENAKSLVFHSVASQTSPKVSFNRPSAAAADDLSITSEESFVECDASCEWLGNVRALRKSHVRLVLRQLQQLREIERLNRTLHRAHVAPHASSHGSMRTTQTT